MIVAKVLAVLAAALLVGSVAIGTLAPQDMTLGDAWILMDNSHMHVVEAFVRAHLSPWVWERPVTALLARPVWFLPAGTGLILAGAAMTAASRHKAAPSRRRRS